MATAASLERRRREAAAAAATAVTKAVRGHRPRAAHYRKMVQATCDALRAEIREAKARRAAARKAELPDLFGEMEAAA
ncbi:hypothetical protein ABLE91_17080 [Aquabacter sp. CN5-332]|uniref:hypothetical protein n=1 Tax=Aquabacter sp. CN5-332 TaxID=3156608 RepID=UPI0032B3F17A